MTKSIIIVGCGYVGERVARAERARGNAVLALTRNLQQVAALQGAGISACTADLDDPSSLTDLPLAGALVYYFVPPPSAGTMDPRMYTFLELARQTEAPAAVVLISTTGVYGNCNGEWVSETRAPAPKAARAMRRLDAERQLDAWGEAHDVRTVILRVPGIYGPGRLPRARLQRREPVLAEAAAPWSNRIHVDDLVRACLAAARPDISGVFNVSDGSPTTMTDYFNRVADVLGLAPPPQLDIDAAAEALSAGMLSYLAESKRIDNRRMREVLGVIPRYGDLAEGLAASLADENAGGP